MTNSVRELIERDLDAEKIHGIMVSSRTGDTIYCVVSQTTENHGGEVIDLRTVVVDLDKETVSVTDNGIWLPKDSSVCDNLTRILGATCTNVSGESDLDTLERSALESVDVGGLLSTEIEPSDTSDSDGDNVPEEIERLIPRLTAAGIGTDARFNRLQFGKKEPFDHDLRSRDGLIENYGVYATKQDSLLLIDVDDPETAPLDQLPETFKVSSAHGSEEQAHHYYSISDLEALRDHYGKYNLGPSWGEIRTKNEYVVGPGSTLHNCDCEQCSQEPGVYSITEDRPIREIETEELISILPSDLDPDQEESETETEIEEAEQEERESAETVADPSLVECFQCGAEIEESDAVDYSDGSQTVYRCRGGCDE